MAMLERSLAGGEYRSTHRLGKCYRCEQRRGIEIIFAGFVDDSQLTVGPRVAVGEDLIDLPGLERDLIAIVAEAEHDYS